MMNLFQRLINFCNDITFWYFISIILGMLIVNHFIIKNEWKKQRIDKKVCYVDDTSFQYRIFWLIKIKLLIYVIIFFGVFLVNILLINETNFNSTLTIVQKIRNIVPIIIVYFSIVTVQKVSIEENSNQMLDKLILLLLKIKSLGIEELVEKEIYYIKKQNKKMIHKLSENYIEEKTEKKQSEFDTGESFNKLLYILLEYSTYDEFEIKHKHEIKAFQSDSKKEYYLARVISIRASLIGEKPFNEKEFHYFCSGVLPEIGISYSDIYTTIKRISKYKRTIVKCQVDEEDSYFQEKFINNSAAGEELSNDLFDQKIDKIFTDDFDGGEKLCTAIDNH